MVTTRCRHCGVSFHPLHSTGRQAERLLREARNALIEELQAAGESEVEEQPQLRAHAKIVTRIERFLVATGNGGPCCGEEDK